MRILVIEDEPKVARALEEGLTQVHYDVCVATTDEEGFYELNAQRFDLVLLDPRHRFRGPGRRVVMHRWRRGSIRARLIAAYAGSMFVILLAYATGVYFFVAHKLEDDLNRDLHGDFEVVESMLVRGDDGSVRFAGGHHYDADEEEQIRIQTPRSDGGSS